jgi:hypothetical protein
MKSFLCVLGFAATGILAAQNVGVGTTTPQSRLEIEGSGNTSATSSLNVVNSDGNSAVFVRDDLRVGINNASPDGSAVLDVSSTQSGILIPRMTTAQKNGIGTPATGLLVFDTDENKFYYYDGAAWVSMVATTGGGGGGTGGDPTLIYTVDGF